MPHHPQPVTSQGAGFGGEQTPDTMKEELEALEHLETQQVLTNEETARLEELYFILGI